MIYLSDHQTIASQCAIPNAQSNLYWIKSEKCLVETLEVGYTSLRYRKTKMFGHTAIPVENLLYSNSRTL